MIGSYAGISFTVSEDKVQTFQEMSRETAARWNTHEVIGAKPKQEFLGPDLDSMTFTMQLSAWRGVSPLQLAERLRQFCSKGEYDNLIVGGPEFWQVPYRECQRNLSYGDQPRGRSCKRVSM